MVAPRSPFQSIGKPRRPSWHNDAKSDKFHRLSGELPSAPRYALRRQMRKIPRSKPAATAIPSTMATIVAMPQGCAKLIVQPVQPEPVRRISPFQMVLFARHEVNSWGGMRERYPAECSAGRNATNIAQGVANGGVGGAKYAYP